LESSGSGIEGLRRVSSCAAFLQHMTAPSSSLHNVYLCTATVETRHCCVPGPWKSTIPSYCTGIRNSRFRCQNLRSFHDCRGSGYSVGDPPRLCPEPRGIGHERGFAAKKSGQVIGKGHRSAHPKLLLPVPGTCITPCWCFFCLWCLISGIDSREVLLL
jgi:hypothetical protein